MRARVLLPCLLAAAVLLGGIVIDPPTGSASKLSEVQRKISVTRGKIAKRKGKERVLTGDIARFSRRINRLQGSISQLQARQTRIEVDLTRRRTQLQRTQRELREQRARLARLKVRLQRGRKVLAERLVEVYRGDDPDLVTVVLSSDGFAQLVEHGETLRRIQKQDTTILTLVKSAKREATVTSRRLDRLEDRQAKLTAVVQQRRDEVAGVKRRLVTTQAGYSRTRAGRTRVLKSVRHERHALESDLGKLVKESNKIQGRLAGISGGPIKQGSGRFIWPMNGTITSPFCESRSWESCHPGLDIAAPHGTPIRAADSGTVRIAGPTGGYGNFTCIQHTKALTTCYGHQSSIGVSVGQSVSKGQIIGREGSTGFSTGPHLHFEVRVNGAVVNPMNYL